MPPSEARRAAPKISFVKIQPLDLRTFLGTGKGFSDEFCLQLDAVDLSFNKELLNVSL